VSLCRACVCGQLISASTNLQPLSSHLSALADWWLQIALGVSMAAFCSTFIFPVTAGEQLRESHASASGPAAPQAPWDRAVACWDQPLVPRIALTCFLQAARWPPRRRMRCASWASSHPRWCELEGCIWPPQIALCAAGLVCVALAITSACSYLSRQHAGYHGPPVGEGIRLSPCLSGCCCPAGAAHGFHAH